MTGEKLSTLSTLWLLSFKIQRLELFPKGQREKQLGVLFIMYVGYHANLESKLFYNHCKNAEIVQTEVLQKINRYFKNSHYCRF
jgi:hypothetical protein